MLDNCFEWFAFTQFMSVATFRRKYMYFTGQCSDAFKVRGKCATASDHVIADFLLSLIVNVF